MKQLGSVLIGMLLVPACTVQQKQQIKDQQPQIIGSVEPKRYCDEKGAPPERPELFEITDLVIAQGFQSYFSPAVVCRQPIPLRNKYPGFYRYFMWNQKRP
jgi:hypothetical protein